MIISQMWKIIMQYLRFSGSFSWSIELWLEHVSISTMSDYQWTYVNNKYRGCVEDWTMQDMDPYPCSFIGLDYQ